MKKKREKKAKIKIKKSLKLYFSRKNSKKMKFFSKRIEQLIIKLNNLYIYNINI